MERGEDQITSPNDLALMLLDAPLPEAFPVIHLAGREQLACLKCCAGGWVAGMHPAWPWCGAAQGMSGQLCRLNLPCVPGNPAAETPYPAHGTPLYVLGWGSTDQENMHPAYDLMVR